MKKKSVILLIIYVFLCVSVLRRRQLVAIACILCVNQPTKSIYEYKVSYGHVP